MEISTEKILSDDGQEWIIYNTYYTHGYLGLIVCIIGSIGNILNVLVFTRKRMISPINIILASLAMAHLVELLPNYYTAWYFHLEPYIEYSYQTQRIILWQIHITSISMNTSLWLTMLASTCIAKLSRNYILCNTKTACISILLVFILGVLLYLPFATIIHPVKDGQTNITYYISTDNMMNHRFPDIVRNVNVLMIVIVSAMPMILIPVYNVKLMFIFSKMKKNCKKLSAYANTNLFQLKSEKQIARMTHTLVVLSTLCFITQLPVCIGFVIRIIDNDNFPHYHLVTKKFIDILRLTYLAFTFFIYYLTSIKFRKNFNDLIDTPKKESGIQ